MFSLAQSGFLFRFPIFTRPQIALSSNYFQLAPIPNLIWMIIFGRKWLKLSKPALEIFDLQILITTWLNSLFLIVWRAPNRQ